MRTGAARSWLMSLRVAALESSSFLVWSLSSQKTRRTRSGAGNKRGIILFLIGGLTALLQCHALALVKAASPLQCALAKNASVSALECAVTELLDLKSRGMNSYKKGWGEGGTNNPGGWSAHRCQGLAWSEPGQGRFRQKFRARHRDRELRESQ